MDYCVTQLVYYQNQYYEPMYTYLQAIVVLSHAGICMSHTSAWDYLLKLTTDAKYKQKVQEGHWLWVYDNLNVHQKVRHERQGE